MDSGLELLMRDGRVRVSFSPQLAPRHYDEFHAVVRRLTSRATSDDLRNDLESAARRWGVVVVVEHSQTDQLSQSGLNSRRCTPWYNGGMAKILIVEDDSDACEGMLKLFEKAGHEVTCMPNGREALAHVINHVPDVVLLDLLMPEMDGPTFLEVVRSYLRLQALPVVVLTGLADSPMVDRARFLKVNSILTKAKASPAEILQAVEEAVVRVPG